MKKRLLGITQFLLIAALMMFMLVDKPAIANAATNSKTIDCAATKASSLISSSKSSDVQTFTLDGIDYNYVNVYQNYATYIMFPANESFLYNSTEIDYITSIELTYGAGCSTDATVGVHFSSSNLSTRETTNSTKNSGAGNTQTFANDDIKNNKYFQIAVGSTNCRISKIVINYDDGKDNYSVTVINGTADKESYSVGDTATITANDIENKTFSYWVDSDNNIISYDKAYSFLITDNVSYKAIFAYSSNVIDFTKNTTTYAATTQANALTDSKYGIPYPSYVSSITGTYTYLETGSLCKLGSTGNQGKIIISLTDGYTASGINIKLNEYSDDSSEVQVNSGTAQTTPSDKQIYTFTFEDTNSIEITATAKKRVSIYTIELTGVKCTDSSKSTPFIQMANTLVDDKGVMRIISVADSADYSKYSFNISFTSDASTNNSGSGTYEAKKTYESVKATYNNASTVYTALTLGGACIYGLEIYNIPLGTYTFKITSVVVEDDVEYYSTEKSYTVVISADTISITPVENVQGE